MSRGMPRPSGQCLHGSPDVAGCGGAAGHSDADVHERHCPDLPGQVRGLPSAGFDRADVTCQLRTPVLRSRNRVEARQMPPWEHPTRTIGIQEFKNDRAH